MIRELLATCLYVGYVRVAPGTCGSLVALAIGLAAFTALGGLYGGLAIIGAAAVLTWPGAMAGTWAESFFRRKDPPPVVIDEVVGCFLSLAPAIMLFPNAVVFLVGGIPFAFFRLFDILKPWPASRLERIRGGWGIMLDDIAAGCYAAAASIAVLRIVA